MNPELKTIQVMIRLYCRSRHKPDADLCPSCRELMDYAGLRIEKCPFGTEKPTCENCTVHCYKPDMREMVKEVMRYSGPRMLTRHPVLAVRHFIPANVRNRPRPFSGRL